MLRRVWRPRGSTCEARMEEPARRKRSAADGGSRVPARSVGASHLSLRDKAPREVCAEGQWCAGPFSAPHKRRSVQGRNPSHNEERQSTRTRFTLPDLPGELRSARALPRLQAGAQEVSRNGGPVVFYSGEQTPEDCRTSGEESRLEDSLRYRVAQILVQKSTGVGRTDRRYSISPPLCRLARCPKFADCRNSVFGNSIDPVPHVLNKGRMLSRDRRELSGQS